MVIAFKKYFCISVWLRQYVLGISSLNMVAVLRAAHIQSLCPPEIHSPVSPAAQLPLYPYCF